MDDVILPRLIEDLDNFKEQLPCFQWNVLQPSKDLAWVRFSEGATCERIRVHTQKTWIWTCSSFTELTGRTHGLTGHFIKDSAENLIQLFFYKHHLDQCSAFLITGHILGNCEPTDSKLPLLLFVGWSLACPHPAHLSLWLLCLLHVFRPICLAPCLGGLMCASFIALTSQTVAITRQVFMYSADFPKVSSNKFDRWSPFHISVNILGWAP
jgi:hypothetical protein